MLVSMKKKKKRSKSKQNQKQHIKRCTIIVFDDLAIPFSPSSFRFICYKWSSWPSHLLTLLDFRKILPSFYWFMEFSVLGYIVTALWLLSIVWTEIDISQLCSNLQWLLSNVPNTAILHPCPSSSTLLGSPVLTLLR